ncbi:unnamed protein product, partial [Amoebophrya sp. A120]
HRFPYFIVTFETVTPERVIIIAKRFKNRFDGGGHAQQGDQLASYANQIEQVIYPQNLFATGTYAQFSPKKVQQLVPVAAKGDAENTIKTEDAVKTRGSSVTVDDAPVETWKDEVPSRSTWKE